MAAFANRFGVDSTRILVTNTFFAPGEEFTAGDLAKLALDAPNASGLTDVIKNAVASQDGNYGWVYELQVEKNLGNSVTGYHVQSASPVTYAEAVAWDANGLPVLGGSVTETAEGDVALSGNKWIEAKTARYVSGTDGALNDFVNNALRGQALLDSKQITSYTVWMKEYPQPSLLAWLWSHAPSVDFEIGLPH